MSRAFCPGHVTGFFAIHDEAEDVLSRGSRGAGVCLSRGVVSRVSVRRGEPGIAVRLNGATSAAPTTTTAIRGLLRGEPLRVEVDNEVQLPVSQGFGMSAAGALAAALALATELGRDPQEALEAAHAAEVENRTGLGDVAAAWAGGFEVRVKAGCPPRGEVQPISAPNGDLAVVLCVVEGPLETKRVLTDPAARTRIQAAGDRLVEMLLASPTPGRMAELSKRFAFETGLATARLREAIAAVEGIAPASQSMLGNSVFALCARERVMEAERALAAFGRTVVCDVASQGPRVL